MADMKNVKAITYSNKTVDSIVKGLDVVWRSYSSGPYRFLQYIQSTGTQAIDTGFNANRNSWLKLKVEDVGAGASRQHGRGAVYNAQRFAAGYNNGNYFFGLGNAWINPTDTVTSGPHILGVQGPSATKLGSGQGYSIDGTFTSNSNTYPSWDATSANWYSIYLFGSRGDTTGSIQGPLTCKLYWAEYGNGNTTEHYLVPAQRKSDGKLGLYDAITNTFLSTLVSGSDSNTLVAGPTLVENTYPLYCSGDGFGLADIGTGCWVNNTTANLGSGYIGEDIYASSEKIVKSKYNGQRYYLNSTNGWTKWSHNMNDDYNGSDVIVYNNQIYWVWAGAVYRLSNNNAEGTWSYVGDFHCTDEPYWGAGGPYGSGIFVINGEYYWRGWKLDFDTLTARNVNNTDAMKQSPAIDDNTNCYVWTDGTNIYCSNGQNQRKLGTSGISTGYWNTMTWNGDLTQPIGEYIYRYNGKYYHLDNGVRHRLEANDTWVLDPIPYADTTTGLYGNDVWSPAIGRLSTEVRPIPRRGSIKISI